MKKRTLSEAHQQLLHAQVIDADQPGPVLRDFQTVLDYVGTEGVKAAGKYNLLPLEAIGELDPRLSRPLGLQLKRPQLRSHPYLQGLHLLLRASGLSRVEGAGPKARLVVDPVVLQQWQQLNPTERYFTLLEALFLRGRMGMVGERESLYGSLLTPCLQTWQEIPAKGRRFDRQRPQDVYFLGIGREFYLLALMGLFGLMAIEHPAAAVQPWVPAGVRHVPFGDAVFTLLAEQFPLPWRAFLEEDDEAVEDEAGEAVRFGHWQPLFQPYFPEWRANLVLPAAETREGTFIFRVSLGQIWRRIALPADATLGTLVDWILRSVDFDSDHLYEFTYRDRFGAARHARHPFDQEGPWADDVVLGTLPLAVGQSMQLTYDFGDNWQFDIKLETIEPPGAKIKAPRILEKHGKAPEQYPNWE